MAVKEILCTCLIVMLLIPSLSLFDVSFQDEQPLPGVWTVRGTHEIDYGLNRVVPNTFFEEVRGEFRSYQLYENAFSFKGNGTGNWKWTDLADGECSGYEGSGEFDVTFRGSIIEDRTDQQNVEVRIDVEWFVGTDDAMSDDLKYAKLYAVGCGDNTYEEQRASLPMPVAFPQFTHKSTTLQELFAATEVISEPMPGFTQKSTVQIELPVLGEKIQVNVDKPTLNPTDTNPKSKITITATKPDGTKIKEMEIRIEACTQTGGEDTDGHLHDSERKDPCDKSRVNPILMYEAVEHKSSLNAKTDDNGQIILDYEPPFNYRVKKDGTINTAQKLYISGEDKIIATKISDPTIKGEASITTKVPGLQQMSGSENCGNTDNYYFNKQGQHGCMFYGTPSTNEAIARFAKAFMDKQEECKQRADGKCNLIDAQGNNVTFTITGDNKKVRITAMSLPWGGAHDIKGDWKNPHVTHKDGKALDIGLRDFRTETKNPTTKKITTTLDENRIKLLWTVISLDSNFKSFESGEGDPYSATVDHFHANFKS